MYRLTLLGLSLCLVATVSAFAQDVSKSKNKASNNKIFQVGAELRQYKYTETGYVTHSGLMYGIWGELLWDSFIGAGRLNANMLFGALSYDGALCDISNNCSPYQATTNDLISKISSQFDYNLNSAFAIQTGLGFRYLYDKGEGVGFYRRTGTWIFFPLGTSIKFDTDLGPLVFELEYDLILSGGMKSNLSEASSSFSDVYHTQTGYGLVVSGGLQFKNDLNLIGYYELWDLNESDAVQANGLFFVEPKNSSQSFGLKLGYKF